MMESNKELKTRREFFKKTLKGTLPFLGLLSLVNVVLGGDIVNIVALLIVRIHAVRVRYHVQMIVIQVV